MSGEVPHKDKWYKGLHDGILNPELFNKAQEILKENRIKDMSITNHKESSLLVGRIFDDKSNYMSPSHSNKKGKRYRYYLCQAVIRHEKQKNRGNNKDSVGRNRKLRDRNNKRYSKILKTIQRLLKDFPINTHKEVLKKSKEINLTPQIIRDTISKIKIFKEKIEVTYYPQYIKEILLSHYENRSLKQEVENKTEEIIEKDIRITVVDNSSKIIIGIGDEKHEQNEQLIKAVLRAYKWGKKLKESPIFGLKEISDEEKISKRYEDKVLKLAYLSPKITQSIY
ncbi:MAG: hypothetical protein LBF23_01435 [Endomicrobium sp.]|jgi:uncharacterized protein YjgD (DUF1641 family)|nr:hypothetical protein [Endomicrobium sp.]